MKMVSGHPLAIDHLTVLGARPAEMVEIAASLDVGLIGPISSPPGGMVPHCFDLRPGTDEFREMKAALDRTGVRINNMDGAMLGPEVDWQDLTQRVEAAAELGARAVVTLSFDKDADRYFDGYCRLGELTEKLGLLLVLEFTPLSRIGTLDEARQLVEKGGFAHARVLVDLMHLMFSGGSPEDLAGLGPDLLSGAQICDGALQMTFEQYLKNAIDYRNRPGEGEYPFAEFIRALPEGLPMALEVPRKAEREAGMAPIEQARLAVQAALRF